MRRKLLILLYAWTHRFRNFVDGFITFCKVCLFFGLCPRRASSAPPIPRCFFTACQPFAVGLCSSLWFQPFPTRLKPSAG